MTICGYEPGAAGWVIGAHGRYYARHWGFGREFETLVGRELSEFLAGFDPAQDGFWIAKEDERIAGSIAIVSPRDGQGARLRWFIVDDAFRGRGVGRRLMDAAMDFCKSVGYRKVWLTTFAGLDAARRLYEDAGFKLTHEAPDRTWGVTTTEQRFDWSA